MIKSPRSVRARATTASPVCGVWGHRWAARLPRPVKRWLLARYWPLKALAEEWQDYSAELVGHIPSHAFRIGWYRHICRMRLGSGSSIHRRCRVYRPYRITIGDHTVINYGVLLDGRGGLSIGDNVSVSEGVAILTMDHDVDDPGFAFRSDPVTIEDYVFVGSYARILPGVVVGEGAVVAACAVVTRDVEPYTVVGGVPARYIRDRARDLTYELEYRKVFG
jgi:putative colanic acid biosynthesis acetyltransferase WcaF